MKFCSQCGTQYDDDARFCGNCGYAFPDIQPEAQTTAPAADTQSAQTPVNEPPVQAPANEAPVPAPAPAIAQPAQTSVGAQPAPAAFAQQTPVASQNASAGQNAYAGQNVYTAPVAAAPVKKRSAGLSVAGFVLSFFIAPVALILCIVALATKSSKKGLAIAGLVLSILGTLIVGLTAAAMIPSLTRYVEKTNVSSDTRLCNDVSVAIQTALADPVIREEAAASGYLSGDYYYVKEIPSNTAFGKKVERNLGHNLKGIESEIKSTYNFAYASGLQFKYDNYSVVVRIENSDNTGNKGNRGAFPITSY